MPVVPAYCCAVSAAFVGEKYLRSTVSQSRLNYMTVLHVHQEEKVSGLDLNVIQYEFVAKNDRRRKSR